MATTINAGRVRFVSRGTYNNSTQYYLFDLVDYNGSSYIAKENTVGHLPTNSQYWQLIAEKGNTGSTGQTGPTGATGNGISTIIKTSTVGLVDTYTITYTNGNTTTFTVTNGEDGEVTETELNELREQVEDLEDNQLTAPASGESIDLSDSAKAKIREPKLIGKSWQNSTTGKNKLNNEMESGTLDSNGQPATSSTGVIRTKNYSEVEPNTQYTLSNDKSYAVYIYEYDENYSLVNSYTGGPYQADHTTITTTATTKYIKVRGVSNQSDLTVKYMLNTGSTVEPYEEYTGGIASPNPGYIQRIRRTGDNVNIFNGNDVYTTTPANFDVSFDNEVLSITHKTSYTTGTPKIDLGVLPKGIYVVSQEGTFNKIGLNRNGSYSTILQTNGATFSCDGTESITIVFGNDTLNYTKFKLEKGSVPTPYSPYGCGNINEKIQNANLFDLKSYLIKKGATYTENDDGSYTITLKQSMYSEPLEFSDENIVVSLSGLITNVTSNNFRIQLLNKNNGSAGLIDENTQVLNNKSASKLRFDWSGSQGGTVTMKNIMLNKGSTALPYVPHAEQNISFLLEEGQYFAEGDYLADDGIHHVRGQVVLDGSEDWKLWSIGLENVERFYLNIEGSSLSNSLCDKFSYIRDNSDQEHYRSSAMDGVYKQFVLFINKLRLSTINVAGLKAWLSENPIEVEYDLVTEVVEPFTEEQAEAWKLIKKAKTYKTVTHISSPDETPATMDMVYVRDLQTVINNLSN